MVVEDLERVFYDEWFKVCFRILRETIEFTSNHLKPHLEHKKQLRNQIDAKKNEDDYLLRGCWNYRPQIVSYT